MFSQVAQVQVKLSRLRHEIIVLNSFHWAKQLYDLKTEWNKPHLFCNPPFNTSYAVLDYILTLTRFRDQSYHRDINVSRGGDTRDPWGSRDLYIYRGFVVPWGPWDSWSSRELPRSTRYLLGGRVGNEGQLLLLLEPRVGVRRWRLRGTVNQHKVKINI